MRFTGLNPGRTIVTSTGVFAGILMYVGVVPKYDPPAVTFAAIGKLRISTGWIGCGLLGSTIATASGGESSGMLACALTSIVASTGGVRVAAAPRGGCSDIAS